jgi:cell division protein FtsW
VVIVLFGLVIQRAFAIGRQASRSTVSTPALVAQGIGVWIGVQASSTWA